MTRASNVWLLKKKRRVHLVFENQITRGIPQRLKNIMHRIMGVGDTTQAFGVIR